MFSRIQTSVIKINDPNFARLSKEQLVGVFKDTWNNLLLAQKEDICAKVGVNKVNIPKNIDNFNTFNFEGVKDSKLQKLAYLAKMFNKLNTYRRQQ